MTDPSLPLATSTWDEAEVRAIQRVVESGRFTMGPEVAEFERRFAEMLGVPYAVMVNSGSSANLLAVATAVINPEIDLSPGDEVLVPAVSWATTYAPIHQYGLVLKFVDIDPETLNLDLSKAERLVGPRTKAIFAVNLLGNPLDFDELEAFAARHSLLILEDNCEALGATFHGVAAGTAGRMGTFSTYFSHHISTIEGGVVVAKDLRDYQTLLSLRAHGWTRELPAQNFLLDKSPEEFDNLFRFVLPGYNLRPVEFAGAIGIEQLKKVPAIVGGRRENARRFVERMAGIPSVRIQRESGESSWFGFAVTLFGPLAGRRAEVIARITEAGIESRPIVAGNFTRNPVMKHLNAVVPEPLAAADEVHKNGFFIGNHHYATPEGIDAFAEILAGL